MTSRDSLRSCLTTLVLGSCTSAVTPTVCEVTPTVCEGVEKGAEVMGVGSLLNCLRALVSLLDPQG